MIQCVIFDCDGTLVDSEYLCNLGLEIKLREYGIKSDARELTECFRGGVMANTIETLEQRYQVRFRDDFVSSYRVLVDELFDDHLRPCEGVVEMLEQIGLPVCVASNGPLKKMQKALSVTGLDQYFADRLYSAYEIGSWKPDPGIYLYAAREMGFHPENCAIVEDSLNGLTAAMASGSTPVLYDPESIHKPVEGVCKIRHMSQLKETIIGRAV